MIKKRHLILCFLVLCLTVTLLVGVTSSADYDPWCDVNDDGIIDIVDIVSLAIRFGEEGEPFTAKAAQKYDSGWLNITDKRGQYFNVTHNLNLVNQSFMPRLYGKVNDDSSLHFKYWYGLGLPGWTQTYGGTNNDHGISVVATGDGGYAIIGGTSSFGAGDYDVWLLKTDANGNLQWNQTYGGTNQDEGYSLVQTGDGGYAITGHTGSFGAGNYDVWLLKTDAFGLVELEWGLTITSLDADTLTLYRGTVDPYWNYVRVIIWVIK